MSALFALKDVAQKYNGRSVLHVPQLTIEAGSITGIVGPNGSGKSTLMRLLALLEEPVAGSFHYAGTPVQGLPASLRREVTLLTQEPYLLRRTVAENVAYGLKVRGIRDVQEHVHDALVAVGLAPDAFRKRQWFELSGGEAQRVALAARIALKPRVLLMDEPTSSLDEVSADRIRTTAVESRKCLGTTLIIVSHDREWLSSVADRLVLIRNGRLEGEL